MKIMKKWTIAINKKVYKREFFFMPKLSDDAEDEEEKVQQISKFKWNAWKIGF